TFNVSDGGTLTLDADAADLRIVTGGPGVQVEVVRHTGVSDRARAEQLFARYALSFNQSGNDLTVTGKYDRPFHIFDLFESDAGLHVRYLVHVPTRYNVSLKTSGGDIDVTPISGAVDARTSGGNVTLASVGGPVNVHTSGGDVKLTSATGKVEIRTSGGSIRIDDASTAVDARTSGGSIEIGRTSGDVYARTSGGDIRLASVTGGVDAQTSGGSVTANFAGQPHPSKLFTSGGDVMVTVGGSAGLDLDAKSSGGDVESDLPVTIQGGHRDNAIVGKINGGGPQFVLRSSGGGIHVKRGA
ncbi:MAG: DUF4097 family beta strand repeat-containing protein, partial [Acidobacteriota bacterium]